MRRLFGLTAALALLTACGNVDAAPGESAALAEAGSQQRLPSIVVYKTVTCGCCGGWVEHMKEAGFAVDVRDLPGNMELMQVKIDAGVPNDLTS